MGEEETKEETVDIQSAIPKEITSALKEEFPRETHETKRQENGFIQTGIKPVYVIERLNEVLGIDGWDYEILDEVFTDYEAMAKVRLNVYMVDKTSLAKLLVASRVQWGGNQISNKKLLSDAKKGAITNAICKAASLIDVAHQAYKGLLPPVEEEGETITDEEAQAADAEAKAKTTEPPVADDEYKKAKKELMDFFVKQKLNRNHLKKLMEKHIGKQESKDLTTAELGKLLEIAKEEANKKATTSTKDSKDNKE